MIFALLVLAALATVAVAFLLGVAWARASMISDLDAALDRAIADDRSTQELLRTLRGRP